MTQKWKGILWDGRNCLLTIYLISDWLISRIYKEYLQLKRKPKQLSLKTKNFNTHLFKEDIQMANNHMKRYSKKNTNQNHSETPFRSH